MVRELFRKKIWMFNLSLLTLITAREPSLGFPFQRYRIAPSKFTRLLPSTRSSVYFISTTILPLHLSSYRANMNKNVSNDNGLSRIVKIVQFSFPFQNSCAKRRRSQRFSRRLRKHFEFRCSWLWWKVECRKRVHASGFFYIQSIQ